MGSTEAPRDPTRRFFRYLWAIWACVAIALIVPLASGQGHPPGFVFIPLVVAGWLAGHLVIWMFALLARRLFDGRRGFDSGKAASHPALWIAQSLLGLVFLSGTGFLLFLFLGTLFWGGHSPLSFWLAVSATWTFHGVALVGAIADTDWSRLFTPAVFACWTVALIVVGVRLVEAGWVWLALCLTGAALVAWLVGALWTSRPKRTDDTD